MDVLQYLEPKPVSPPTYRAANSAGNNVRFPVYEQAETHELPSYSPAVYATTLVLRKTEWLSPYEPSPSRSWKPLVMELNSTQLNFYSVDDLPLIGKYAAATTINKIKSRKQQQHLVLFNQAEHDLVLEAVNRYPQKYLGASNLVRSYTLQHAQMGLPVDYKKRNYCLRFRIETEQIIVQFSSIEEMIHWANIISQGVNVSLDLETRPLPTDRSVPRRRRGAGARNAWGRPSRTSRGSSRLRSYSDSEVIRRELSPPLVLNSGRRGSAPTTGATGSSSGIIGRIFGRKRSSTVGSNNTLPGLKNGSLSTRLEGEENFDEYDNDNDNDNNDDDDDDDDNDDEIPDNEMHSVHELHSEEDDDSITEHDEESSTSAEFFHSFSFGDFDESHYEDIKWSPDPKLVSERKLLKDAIRCIKVLTDDETWIGKMISTPSKPPTFRTCNDIKRETIASDIVLRRRNKFVKQFIVGANGLLNAA